MSWEIVVTMPKETGQIGSISATWTDPDIESGIDPETGLAIPAVFSYSRNARASVVAADAFIAEAIEARDAWQIYQANNNAKSAWALDRLNIADPKVV